MQEYSVRGVPPISIHILEKQMDISHRILYDGVG